MAGHTAKVSTLSGLLSMGRKWGLDDRELLEQSGINPQDLIDPEGRVSLESALLLLDVISRATEREDIGLDWAVERLPSSLGTPGLMAVLQPTLREALRELVTNRREINTGLHLELTENDGLAVLVFDIDAPGARGLRYGVEVVAMMAVSVSRRFLGADWTPRRLGFRHAPPADLINYRKALGWAVEFGHDINSLVMTSKELDQPSPLADPVLRDVASRRLAKHAPAPESLHDTCRMHLREMIEEGIASVDHLARRLGVHRRTLQRRLDEGQLRFSDLLQGVRREMAEEHLRNGSLRMADIADRLGFSSPSAFARWHRATFGVPARQAKSPILSSGEDIK